MKEEVSLKTPDHLLKLKFGKQSLNNTFTIGLEKSVHLSLSVCLSLSLFFVKTGV
jgi:hypothetical protein